MFWPIWVLYYVSILDSVTPALGKLKQEGHTFEASLGYRVGPYQKTKNKKTLNF